MSIGNRETKLIQSRPSSVEQKNGVELRKTAIICDNVVTELNINCQMDLFIWCVEGSLLYTEDCTAEDQDHPHRSVRCLTKDSLDSKSPGE